MLLDRTAAGDGAANVPRKLKYRLAPEHDVSTVPENGWSGLLNGALLRAAADGFDAFVPLDRRIEYQQEVSDLPLRVVVVRAVSNKYEDLLPLVPSIHAALETSQPGGIARVAG
ncbi:MULTISPECIES: hypothetical protein [Rubrivirga]|uniref:LysR substrate-binding domain-containing protein n=1 Tax=Rubrivirga litoralis TaxID=3075598 RepID=A0ABU3BVF5_9BACT|nr:MULTISPECIES: hypothetical protein [unclassified Rubrivirga]MDT0633268.1 hypothetical protein [Rubrivirga sp. F394]